MINSIKLLIAVFASYFPTVAISGYFTAWVAKKLGDATAEEQGFLTLNPLEHTRLFGLGILLVSVVTRFPFIAAFGRQVPIDEHRMYGNFKKIKYLIALWARPFANLWLSLLAIFVWVIFWKTIGFPYQISQHYPMLVDAMQLLYVIFRQINIISLMLELVFGLVVFIMSFIIPELSEESFFVIFVIQIYLLLLVWEFLAPHISHGVRMVEFLFSYIIS